MAKSTLSQKAKEQRREHHAETQREAAQEAQHWERVRQSLPPLVTLGNPRLAQPSQPVNPADIGTPAFQHKLEILYQCLVAYEGIGIAAPQIGWFERVFLMGISCQHDDAEEDHHHVQCFINPNITQASAQLGWAWEGCLSVPGLRGWVRRPLTVQVHSLDAHGQPASHSFDHWDARVFQHEYDHLDGLLYPYRLADPRHLVMLEHMDQRDHWPADWPAPGAAATPLGHVLAE